MSMLSSHVIDSRPRGDRRDVNCRLPGPRRCAEIRRPRALNRALHTVVQSWMGYQDTTHDYVACRTTEGKTSREIKRCPARCIARDLSRLLENGPPWVGDP